MKKFIFLLLCLALLFTGCAKDAEPAPAADSLSSEGILPLIDPAIYDIGELIPQFDFLYPYNEFDIYYNDVFTKLIVYDKSFPLEDDVIGFRFLEKYTEDGKEYYALRGSFGEVAAEDGSEAVRHDPITDIFFYEGDYLFCFHNRAPLTFAETQEILHGGKDASLVLDAHLLRAGGEREDFSACWFALTLKDSPVYMFHQRHLSCSVRKEEEGIGYLVNSEECAPAQNHLIGNTERGIITISDSILEPYLSEYTPYMDYSLLKKIAEHFGTTLADMPE